MVALSLNKEDDKYLAAYANITEPKDNFVLQTKGIQTRVLNVSGDYTQEEEQILDWLKTQLSCKEPIVSEYVFDVFVRKLPMFCQMPLQFKKYAGGAVRVKEAHRNGLLKRQKEMVTATQLYDKKGKAVSMLYDDDKEQVRLIRYLGAYLRSGGWVWGCTRTDGWDETETTMWAALTTWLDHVGTGDADEDPDTQVFAAFAQEYGRHCDAIVTSNGVNEGLVAAWRIAMMRDPKSDETLVLPLLTMFEERNREGAVAMQQSHRNRVDETQCAQGCEWCLQAKQSALMQTAFHDLCDYMNDMSSAEPVNCVMQAEVDYGIELRECAAIICKVGTRSLLWKKKCKEAEKAWHGFLAVYTMQLLIPRYAGWARIHETKWNGHKGLSVHSLTTDDTECAKLHGKWVTHKDDSVCRMCTLLDMNYKCNGHDAQKSMLKYIEIRKNISPEVREWYTRLASMISDHAQINHNVMQNALLYTFIGGWASVCNKVINAGQNDISGAMELMYIGTCQEQTVMGVCV